jgi:hypothetical protein
MSVKPQSKLAQKKAEMTKRTAAHIIKYGGKLGSIALKYRVTPDFVYYILLLLKTKDGQ